MLAPLTEPAVASVFGPRTTIEADGTVEGYASLFGEIDQAREMVMSGAFVASLRTRDVRRVPMLFQHDPAEPVGIWLELREDHRGLYARGRLIPEVQRARELHGLLKAGAIDGLSIGFRTVQARIDPKTRIRRLHAVDLWEISIVTFPLLAGARVHAVKQATSQGKLSHARTRAEREWGHTTGAAANSELSSPDLSPKVGSTRLLANNSAQLGQARVAVRSRLGGHRNASLSGITGSRRFAPAR